ncbi:MAG: hypothetical protein ACRCST_10600, partial [Turicibacter sp.]
MILKQEGQHIILSKGNTVCEFLQTGDVFQFINQGILVNQSLGNTMDGSSNNIYMRVYHENEITYTPLLGIKSGSVVSYNENQMVWSGKFEDIKYSVTFTLATESNWFYSIDVEANDKMVDFIMGQDLSLAPKGATVTNELYTSQYLDHKILEGEQGYVICSRQNQGEVGSYLQQGSLNTKVIGFSTDAMQFFGKEFKKTNEPVALKGNLENVNYQFELAYTALQTEKLHIEKNKNVVFYGIFKSKHELAVSEIEYLDEMQESVKEIKTQESLTNVKQIKLNNKFDGTLVSPIATQDELNQYFPKRKM